MQYTRFFVIRPQSPFVPVQLFSFLLVILSLSCGSLPSVEVDARLPFVAAAGIVAIWVSLCHIGAHAMAAQVSGREISHLLGARWLERQLEAFRWLSLGVVLLCLWGFGLAGVLDAIPGLQSSMLLQAVVLLTPGVAMVAGTWSAEHHYGVRLKYCGGGIAGYIRAIVTPFRSGLAWLVIPVLLLLALIDAVSLLPIPAESQGLVAIVVCAVTVPIALPTLIRRLFSTGEIEPSQRRWIEEIMSAAGAGRIGAIRWDTGGQSHNAIVGGFVRPFRVLLVSDRMLDEMPREQIAMVLLHEAAHLRRFHVPLRMITVLPAWMAGSIITNMLSHYPWGVVAGSIVGISMTMLLLRLVAYRTEHDADVQACRLAEKIHRRCDDVPATYEQAVKVLSSALADVTADNPAARRPTWLHPGVADRVNWMRRQRRNPNSNTNSAGTIANPA